MKAAFYTLGCKLNQAETESIAASFRESGCETVDWEEDSSLYIINTCTVTSKGEQKARRVIRKILTSRPNSLVVITGCYAQLNPEELSSLGDRVVVIPLDRKDLLLDLPQKFSGSGFHGDAAPVLDLLAGAENGHSVDAADRFRFHPVLDGFHTRPSLKIQDGCNNRCSYCRVPLARGSSVSLDLEEVVRRVQLLESNGKTEAVLTGVNITSWESGGLRFPDLLSAIISATGSIRIRLSSIEPEVLDGRFVKALAHPRICPHFHLPVQSGSDTVLEAMRRRYRSSRVRDAVAHLRDAVEDPFFAADVITGFPGESDADFARTHELLSELDFSWLHVFPFSPRPGTRAAEMPGRIPEHVTTRRASELQTLSGLLHSRYVSRQIGRLLHVIPETVVEIGGDKYWQGMTENYIKVSIPLVSDHNVRKGDIVGCRPERVRGSSIIASIQNS